MLRNKIVKSRHVGTTRIYKPQQMAIANSGFKWVARLGPEKLYRGF
jgi:hypothetical protein